MVITEVAGSTIVPNLLAGVLTALGGVLLLVFRKPLNAHVYRSQKSFFGERIARRSAGRQPDWVMGALGGLTVIVGMMMLGFAILGIVRAAT